MSDDQRPLLVYLANGRVEPFTTANAWALTGPDDRDLELVEWDWDKHQLKRMVAYFVAGGWVGLTWGQLAPHPRARQIGFKVDLRNQGVE